MNQLEIATNIERTTLDMHLDSIRTLKCALARTATSKFTDIMEAVFMIDEEAVPVLEEEEDEPDDAVPAEAISTKGEASAEPSTSTGGIK